MRDVFESIFHKELAEKEAKGIEKGEARGRKEGPAASGRICDAQEVLVSPEGQEVPFPATAAAGTSASCASPLCPRTS